jgi:hypothetical protein
MKAPLLLLLSCVLLGFKKSGEFQVPLAEPVSVGMKYRDPSTGEFRDPTAMEQLHRSLRPSAHHE